MQFSGAADAVRDPRELCLAPPVFPFAWAVDWGQDRYGLWQSFACKGVRQQLRWLPPDLFLMGSPADELERFDRELQHLVVLTKGFWLADTACTQGLWQAVTGKNPSSFTGDDQLPVDSVNWHDGMEFIARINSLIPGLDLRLPTEAQWEYACRAGTSTPFSFGPYISTAQVNFKGNYHYYVWPQGQYREKTVAVKFLPCNNWGLYEMHGNLWEWCSDWLGDYQDVIVDDPQGPAQGGDEIYEIIKKLQLEIVDDPQGPAQGVLRVLRGGSWLDDGRFVRSAFRGGDGPGHSYHNIGLRLSRGQ